MSFPKLGKTENIPLADFPNLGKTEKTPSADFPKLGKTEKPPSANFPKPGKKEKPPSANFPKLGKNNNPNISNKKTMTMFPNALQWLSIALHGMDNATLLSFVNNVDEKCQAENAAQMRTTMGQFYTDFHAGAVQYDQVFNPARKSLETEDLKNCDDERDNSLGAYHEAILGLQRNPNDAKRQAARLLNLNYDTYKPERNQEYMKETELINQMTTDIRSTAELLAAIQLLGLDDYLTDLEQKNQAFAQLVKSRTASTEGYQKGAVAEARTALEQKYQLLRQMVNVASIYEGDEAYRPFLLAVNAEVEHYRQILARKGVSSGDSGSNGGSGTGEPTNGTNGTNGDNGTNEPTNPSDQNNPTNPTNPTNPDNGGGNTGGGGDEPFDDGD